MSKSSEARIRRRIAAKLATKEIRLSAALLRGAESVIDPAKVFRIVGPDGELLHECTGQEMIDTAKEVAGMAPLPLPEDYDA